MVHLPEILDVTFTSSASKHIGEQMKLPKTEYEYLLGFYLNLSVFDPFTSTFVFMTAPERQEIMLTISVLQRKLQQVMPKVQDREITGKTHNPQP